MHTFTILFILFLIVTSGVQLWLSLRQAKHVAEHRPVVPEEFADKITLEEHQKAADYTHAKGAFGRINLIISAVVLLIWTLGGGLNWLDELVRSYGYGPLTTGVIVIIAFSIISSIIDIPASLYSSFVIEEKFGFNKLTLKVFFYGYDKRCAFICSNRYSTNSISIMVNGVSW